LVLVHEKVVVATPLNDDRRLPRLEVGAAGGDLHARPEVVDRLVIVGVG
jgi:hypothetical protein